MDNFTTGGAKHGIEPALSYYTTHGTPYFALYIGKPTARHGNVMMHNWKGRIEEVEEAAQHIRERFMDTGIDSRTRYTLAWWDERPKMTKGTPDEAPSGSVVFVCATEEQISGRIEGYRERIGYVNNEIVSRLAAIEARLPQQEEEDDDTLDGDPTITAHVENVVLTRNRSGYHTFAKPKDSLKIDGAVTLTMSGVLTT